ncbi:unnamed protein product [Laminaria digitata]
MAAASAGPCGVHMELGGKSAMIVFDDVEDMNATVDWCVRAPEHIADGVMALHFRAAHASQRLLRERSASASANVFSISERMRASNLRVAKKK